MKLFVTGIGITALLAGMNINTVNKQPDDQHLNSADNKKVVVYTTAKGTNYRLTATDTLQFSHMGQPFETQVCVFVDPSKLFKV